MDHLLYGAAYYDEYMPYERLDKDIRMLKDAGMNVIRIGESTWSTCEPQEGVFDWHHVTRVIEAAGKAGISVILGTPTYAVPTWLVQSYPEVLAETHAGRGIYGARQIMDITSPVYLYYAERVIRQMMENCAHYDNVIGVQLDNETKAYDTAGKNVQRAFLKYLREKFHDDLDAMNHEFGLDYWSNRINTWEDFPDVRGTINGSLGAEFERFQRKLAADYLMWQRKIVEPYLRKDQFITHNTDFHWDGYSHGLNDKVDVYEDAKAMTVVGTDIYHLSGDRLTGMEIAFGGDLTRSVKQDNYLVLETEAQGQTGWLPFDGQLRLQAYAHLASGANMVEYWHWHSIHNSFETYWKGVLSQDFRENDVYRACQTIGGEWKRIGAHLVNLKKHNRAAILVSNTALTALQWFPIHGQMFDPDSAKYGYNNVLMEVYDAMYRRNIECDFLFPQNAAEEIGEYDLVVIPALYAAPESLLETIRKYVRDGGHIVTTFRTAVANENNKVWSDALPHGLTDVFGMSYSLFTYPGEIGLTSGCFDAADEKPKQFMELLQVEDPHTRVLAYYRHPCWNRYAAVTEHDFGKGSAIYIGCDVSAGLLTAILEQAALAAGIPLPEETFPVIIRKGTNDYGRELTYYMNFSWNETPVKISADGVDLLSGETVSAGEELTLGSWDVRIVEGH